MTHLEEMTDGSQEERPHWHSGWTLSTSSGGGGHFLSFSSDQGPRPWANAVDKENDLDYPEKAERRETIKWIYREKGMEHTVYSIYVIKFVLHLVIIRTVLKHPTPDA